MQLLRCSSEDADSVWFWQCLEQPINTWTVARSEEVIKDMLNRFRPEYHGSKTPLQLAAVCAATYLSWISPSQKLPDMRCLEGIIAAIITTGAEVHGGNHHHTPLMLFLATVSERGSWSSEHHPRSREIQRKLVMWLKILQRAGVDLVAYGSEERRQFRIYCSLEVPVPPLLHWHNTIFSIFTKEVLHFNVSFGPEPEDWRVQLDHMIDQYVGDFWQMPGLLDGDKIRGMPGSWIEEV
jgi:hypothetical protein